MLRPVPVHPSCILCGIRPREVLRRPPGAVSIIRSTLFGIGEDGIGGDDEAVAVDQFGWGDCGGVRGGFVAVGVVEFDEGVEAGFAVRA